MINIKAFRIILYGITVLVILSEDGTLDLTENHSQIKVGKTGSYWSNYYSVCVYRRQAMYNRCLYWKRNYFNLYDAVVNQFS